jgi:hypothetical protein
MKRWRISLRESVLLIAILTILVYVAERKWVRHDRVLNSELIERYSLPAQYLYDSSWRLNNHYGIRASVKDFSDASKYLDSVEDRIASLGWKKLHQTSHNDSSDLVHFERWYVEKDGTFATLTLAYPNEALSKQSNLIRAIESNYSVELFLDLSTRKESSEIIPQEPSREVVCEPEPLRS